MPDQYPADEAAHPVYIASGGSNYDRMTVETAKIFYDVLVQNYSPIHGSVSLSLGRASLGFVEEAGVEATLDVIASVRIHQLGISLVAERFSR